MNKEPNVYSFNDECYVYLGDYKQLQNNWNELKHKVIDLFNRSQDVCYLNVLEKNARNRK